jgi:hypothetical protein
MPVDKIPSSPNGQAGSARPDRNNPVAVEAFDRERMGLAAKE